MFPNASITGANAAKKPMSFKWQQPPTPNMRQTGIAAQKRKAKKLRNRRRSK